MKKLLFIIIVTTLMLSSCGKKDNSKNVSSESRGEETTAAHSTSDDEDSQEKTPEESKTTANEETQHSEDEGTIIKSIESDFDGDDESETVQIIQVTKKPESKEEIGEIEGRIKIKDRDITTIRTFVSKAAGLTGIIRDVSTEDLDGDNVNDIFIVIPETGNPFTLNYFYIYNYKKDKSYLFSIDNNLISFCKGFSFTYEKEGILTVENKAYNFKGEFNLSEIYGFPVTNDEINSQYNNSWIEPVPSEISKESKVKLVNKDNTNQIMIPLPIFGTATSDIIGEVYLYYSVNEDFVPEMKSFEVFALTTDKKIKVGEGSIS